MKAVTDCSGSKGTDPTETVIQVSPATGYKQSQKTLQSHSSWCVSWNILLVPSPSYFCCPYFWASHHHYVAQFLVSPLNYGHLTPSIQEISHLWTGREIPALFSGLCETVPPGAQDTGNCHGKSVPLSSPQKNWELQSPLEGNSMGEGKSSC